MINKEIVAISIDSDVLQIIDKKREGIMNRSAYINNIIRKSFGLPHVTLVEKE